jgi:glutaredoxin-dependent peroxiredoxin
MAAEIGAIAPDFTLMDENRRSVTLSHEIGSDNIVLAFFPAAFSGTCTKEMCTLRDSLAMLQNLRAKVFGISVDTFFALKAWADQQRPGFPLLSDFNREVIGPYDVVNPDMIGLKNIAKRAVVVIDRKGVVRYREVLDDARNEPDYQELKQVLAALH